MLLISFIEFFEHPVFGFNDVYMFFILLYLFIFVYIFIIQCLLLSLILPFFLLSWVWNSNYWFKTFPHFLKITDDIQYYFILVSGVQHSGGHLYNLLSDACDQSSTHLAAYTVIVTLFTVFPMLYFTSQWLFFFFYYQFALLNPFTFFTPPSNHLPSGNHQFVLSMSLFLDFFGHLFCSFDYIYKWNHMAYVFLCLTSFTSRSTCVVVNGKVSFLMANVIFHCVYVSHLCPIAYGWELGLLPYLGYCK